MLFGSLPIIGVRLNFLFVLIFFSLATLYITRIARVLYYYYWYVRKKNCLRAFTYGTASEMDDTAIVRIYFVCTAAGID